MLSSLVASARALHSRGCLLMSVRSMDKGNRKHIVCIAAHDAVDGNDAADDPSGGLGGGQST